MNNGVDPNFVLWGIALTGFFTLASSFLTSYIQTKIKKLELGEQKRDFLRQTARSILTEADKLYGRSHDTQVIALQNMLNLLKSEPGEAPLVRPYEIGELKSHCIYFPACKEHIRKYEKQITASLVNALPTSADITAKEIPKPEVFTAQWMMKTGENMKIAEELKNSLYDVIEAEVRRLI